MPIILMLRNIYLMGTLALFGLSLFLYGTNAQPAVFWISVIATVFFFCWYLVTLAMQKAWKQFEERFNKNK